MKRTAILATAISILTQASMAAAETPAELTQQLIVQMQKSMSMAPVAEKLDWQGAYETLDPAERAQMKYGGPEDLKKHELDAYEGEAGKINDSVKKAASDPNLPEQQKRILQTMKERLTQSIEAQKADAQKAFLETVYTVGKETVEKDSAKVEVIKRRGENSSSENVEFKRVDGQWKLISAAPLSPNAAPKNQLKSLLGPSAVSATAEVARPF